MLRGWITRAKAFHNKCTIRALSHPLIWSHQRKHAKKSFEFNILSCMQICDNVILEIFDRVPCELKDAQGTGGRRWIRAIGTQIISMNNEEKTNSTTFWIFSNSFGNRSKPASPLNSFDFKGSLWSIYWMAFWCSELYTRSWFFLCRYFIWLYLQITC